MNARLIAAGLFALILSVSGCFWTRDPVNPSNDAGPSVPPPTNTTGSLRILVAGLPADTDANVVITGPSGTAVATGASGIGNLTPGSYVVTASDVLTGAAIAAPTQVTQTVSIAAGSTQTVSITYTIGRAFALKLENVIAANVLSTPTFLTAPPNDSRLFVAERTGRIRVVQSGVLLATPFLDISARVSTAGEGGLLSFAFDPAYATNRFVFVHFTDGGGNIVVERYSASLGDPNVAVSTGTPVISIPHPGFSNHYGGRVAFGPDGLLYLSTGDGGGSGDPNKNGQNLNVLLGKVLRLSVAALPYSIPTTNPFAGQTNRRGEIWAYGLRNPWRFAFDAPAGHLYIADVGQNEREEINVVEAAAGGRNFGWSITEGSICFPATAACDKSGLIEPVLEYNHQQGCSIAGGSVYRGSALPELEGRFFYSDYCSGWLRSMRYVGTGATERVDWNTPTVGRIISLGQDAAGELYVLAEDGRVARIARQ